MKNRFLTLLIASLVIVFAVLISDNSSSYSVEEEKEDTQEEVLGVSQEVNIDDELWWLLTSAYNEEFEYKEEAPIIEENQKQAASVGVKKDDP